MSTHPEISHLAKEERIRAIAYSLWEEEGCIDGHDQEHWLRACELVEAEAIADPDWLLRSETETAEAAPAVKPETAKNASLDDLVKRMKGSRAA